MNVTTLDCTLRDGGYYTNWDYSEELVEAYLNACDSAGIDYIEIGLRLLPRKNFLGAYAYCTDNFLSGLRLPIKSKIGVMINAKDYICDSPTDEAELLYRNFANKNESPVSLVRIAAHFNEVSKSENIAKKLKELGYVVGFNLMQISNKSDEEVISCSKMINDWGCVDVLYFADSLGSMHEKQVLEKVELLKKEWKKPLGIHTHNNMGQALSNSIIAFKNNVTWLDATILGMGRGAGNAKMEHLLIELSSLGCSKLKPESLFHIVLKYFTPMQEIHGWGESLLYYLSAKFEIHPTFIQEILSKENFNIQQALDTVEYLKDKNSTSYDPRVKGVAQDNKNIDTTKCWSAENFVKGKNVLVLANGPSCKKYKTAIENLIKKEDLIVFSLNVNQIFSPEFIHYTVASTKTRLFLDSEKYKKLKTPLIAPLSVIPDEVKLNLKDINILNYEIIINQDDIEISNKFCKIPFNLVAPYLFSILIKGHPERILLAGFDGYAIEDYRQREMEDVFSRFQSLHDCPPFIAITPTTYSILNDSVFSPGLLE